MSKRWTIHIEYRDGDSFKTFDNEGEVGISWIDLDTAKKALRWIGEMHKAIEENNRYNNYASWEEKMENLKKCQGFSDKFSDTCMMLPLDDGSLQRISMFWEGYFERLKMATIIVVNDGEDDMRYVP